MVTFLFLESVFIDCISEFAGEFADPTLSASCGDIMCAPRSSEGVRHGGGAQKGQQLTKGKRQFELSL